MVSLRKVDRFDSIKLAENEELIKEEECLSSVNAIQDALYVLNGKWKLPLIYTLIEKPRRFNEIQQAIQGITPKNLSRQLKELEMNGF
ncbi:winged helix-turn-helix transcriptional regulator [Desertivirga xinjiangensis]|uniref:winged helix-turn-helix transcriptional regulator n=1 Tax=Desertivirga xinjiangensis TaxID=539206 RepID=UPI002109A920